MMNRDAKINFNNNTIEITKAFAKRAANPTSEEFKELMELRKSLAGFEVVVKASAKRTSKKDTLKGLNYEFMKQYIARHDDSGEVMEEFTKRTVKNEDNLATQSYGEVKKWFLEQYPTIAKAA